MEKPVEIRHTLEKSPYGKSRKQNVTARPKPCVSFGAYFSGRFSSDLANRTRDDLVSARAGVHKMVEVNRFLHEIENVPKENKIAARERASRSFLIHRFQDCNRPSHF